jgi:ribosomal protein S18 acetylase RimI-like enzyme
MDVTVREATEADGEDLLPLWRGFAAHLSAFNARYAPKEGAEDRWLSYFENQLLDSKYSVVLLAEGSDGEYVGVLEARIVGEHPIFQLGRHGQIYGLYVREDVRNRGVGRALLEAAEDWFGEDPRGVEFYRIETVDGDEESAAALRGLDMEPVSHTFEGDA